jgi:hypothetical protein
MVKAPPPDLRKEERRPAKGLLALDIRPQRLGYALLDGSQLLDWGIATYRVGDARTGATARRRITELLDHHYPALVVQRNRRNPFAESRKTLAAIGRMMRAETARRSIQFRTLNTEMLMQFYAQHGCENKAQIAALVAGWFPELAWKLPPKRKLWEHEHNNAVIFDAVAVGVAFQKTGDQDTMTG